MAQGYFNAGDDLERRQALAQALYQQNAANQGGGQMVSGRYVYTPLQAFADAAKTALSGYALGAANKQIKERDEGRNKTIAELLVPNQAVPAQAYPTQVSVPGVSGDMQQTLNLDTPALPDPNADKRAMLLQLLNGGAVDAGALAPMAMEKLGLGAPKAPIKVGKDDRLVDPTTFKPLVDAVAPPVNYNQPFMADGTPNQAYQDYQASLRKSGAPVTNLNVNTDKSFGSELGGGAAKILDASANAARGSLQTIETANQIRSAIDTGAVTAGPGASAIQLLNQISGNDPQKVVATRQAIQGLAKLALAGRSALKGQGQISDFEGKLLERATTGTIDSLTVPEIRTIADLADKAARLSIQQNASNVAKARSVPGSGNVVDFYDVPMPPVYTATVPSAQSSVDDLLKKYGVGK